jgi:predicted membrane channel-forming protein YqfA (hemolysin III family)
MLINLALNIAISISNPIIDLWAHLGGFVGGVLLALAIIPFYDIEKNKRADKVKAARVIGFVGFSAFLILFICILFAAQPH